MALLPYLDDKDASPEVLKTFLYSTCSDVWSFGVVCWRA